MKNWWKQSKLRIDDSSEIGRHATWLELFYDLIFVVAIAQLAHNLNQDISLSGFLSFVVLFLPVWWAWVGATLYANRFDTDDLCHRLLTAMQIVAVAALAVNIHDGLGETSAGFAISYALVRALLIVEYLRVSQSLVAVSKLTNQFIRGFGSAALLWLVSAFVPIPLRFVFWGLGMIVDLTTPLKAGQLETEFAPHISHLPERFGLFTIIVLGESIVAVVNGITYQQWNVSSAIAAVFGLTIAFSLWWIYFENLGGSAIQAARSCRNIRAYQIWLYMHLPLFIGLTATGVGVEHIISLAHNLTLPSAERWLICSAVAMCLLSFGVICMTSLSIKNIKRCQIRPLYRIGAAAVVIILAAVSTNLSPVELIGLVAAICVAQIVLDLRDAPRHKEQSFK